MFARAVSRYTRISPKKARLLTRPLGGLTVEKAFSILNNTNKKAARLISNVLKSAFNNAKRKDSSSGEAHFYISKITADDGPSLKRYRAMSMGRAGRIRKRTSHITVHLDRKVSPEKKIQDFKKPAKKRTIFKKRLQGVKEKRAGQKHSLSR